MSIQLDQHGRLRHLLTLEDLPKRVIVRLLDRAEALRTGEPAAARDILRARTVACAFLEPSTRTRWSFELAALRLGADVINFDPSRSSEVKGETLVDTFTTLEAMGVDVFIVRTAEHGVPAAIAATVKPDTAVLNAGEGCLSHPTQGLLDALTIRRHKPALGRLRVGIVGDIAHSRVARSAAQALTTLGVAELRLIAPPQLQPAPKDFPAATRYDDLQAGIEGLDVIMALRIQHERMQQADIPNLRAYAARYGLTAARIAHAAADAIVMHPGPMNRGVEIDDEVADGPRSVIREQVANGVAVRMAVLSELLT